MLERIRHRVERAERWAQWRFRPAPKSNNSYTGVYSTFEQAQAAIDAGATGFDSAVGAGMYTERLDKVFPEDYPALFWLKDLAPKFSKVFDFGGHVGLHFYGLRQRLELSAKCEWVVADVPQVMAEGERLAKSRGAKGLRFEGGFAPGDGADLFLSSGALQFLEHDALARAIEGYAKRPKHVVLNKMPVTQKDAFVTVQDTWMIKAPYTVFSHGRLVSSLEKLGYKLADEWANPGHHCMVWREPERSVTEFSGFYFRLA
jgi:putative methyltransferase (TIGR04325 family)